MQKELECDKREEDSEHETEQLLCRMFDGQCYCYCVKRMRWK